MNIGFYIIIFQHTNMIGEEGGWKQNEFFVFLATTWFINSIVQTFFMPNAQEFSELIRTGNLDFALLKPIDTQFLISFQKMDWAPLSNFVMAVALLVYSLINLTSQPETPLTLQWSMFLLYPFFILCGVMIMYSIMVALASTSIWLGRNQTLYNFWFYITNFSRYPMEIYQRGWGWALWGAFTFVVPVLVVVNIPARIMAQPLRPVGHEWYWPFIALAATLISVLSSRFVFKKALGAYRSASS